MTEHQSTPRAIEAPAALSRRTLFAGAGTAGALAAMAAAMPSTRPAAEKTAVAQAATADGYQLTEHVKRYYQTARV